MTMHLDDVAQVILLVLLGAGIFWLVVRRRRVRQWAIFGAIGLGLGFGAIGTAFGQPESPWWYWSGVAIGAGIAGVVSVRRARRSRPASGRSSR